MNARKVGLIFLLQMLVSSGVSLILQLGNFRNEMPITWNAVLSQLIVLLPALVVFLFSGDSIHEVIRFRRMRVVTVLLLIIVVGLLEPLMIACNAFSMALVPNEVISLSPEILKQPFLLMFFLIGVFGPICEELVFRGVIYGGLRKSGRIFAAIMLQAFLFGLMHGNFNQFCYAFVIGVAMGFVYEATGSIFATIWIHILINSPQIILMYAIRGFLEGEAAELMSRSGNRLSPAFMILMGLYFLFIAMFTTTLLGFLLYAISALEGRSAEFKGMLLRTFVDRLTGKTTDQSAASESTEDIPQEAEPALAKPASLWSIPCIIGCVLCVIKIVLDIVGHWIG